MEKTVLISAFPAFGPYKANIGELVAKRVHGETLGGYRIRTILFPCDMPEAGHNRGKVLLEAARYFHASAILSLGMTSLCPGFWLEVRARNLLQQKDYYPNPEKRFVDASHSADTILHPDLTPWRFDTFKRDVESRYLGQVEHSRDIGGFCCEHLIYQVLAAQQSEAPAEQIPYAFLHFPCCPEAPENRFAFRQSGRILLTVDEAVQGIGILLQGAAF